MPPPPRFADVPRRGPSPASAEEVARLMRRVAYAGALIIAWALAGTIAAALSGGVDGATLVVAGALPAALLGLVAWMVDRRRPTHAMSALVAAAWTFAVALALAGHVLYWGGTSATTWSLQNAPPLARWSAFIGALLLVPLYAGARIRALGLAWAGTGSRARSPRLTLESIGRRSDDLLMLPVWRTAWRGLLQRWVEGARLPGLVLMDAAWSASRPTDKLHANASLPEVADALAATGASAEIHGRELHVKLADAPTLRVSVSRIVLPPGPALDVRGDVDAARRLRRLLESEVSHALVFTWSAPARRWERRLNALHKDALTASSLEERSLVMEELDRVRKALAQRALSGEESTVLSLKEESVRAQLALKMLSEPPGDRSPSRLLSQYGALLPDVARVVDAGGLAAVRRITFVPHWIIPVSTRWGELEAVVSAATGRLDAHESRALLKAMRQRGPALFLDVGARSHFLPAPPPTGALLREMRSAGLRVHDDVATGATPADVIFVPYLATAEGYVSGVTGTAAPDLGPVVPIAAGL